MNPRTLLRAVHVFTHLILIEPLEVHHHLHFTERSGDTKKLNLIQDKQLGTDRAEM